MKEAKLNHDIISLFKNTGHFAYKIPDPNQSQVLFASKRPFDGFARFSPPVNDFWFEAKLIKNKLCAFALDRVEPHQYESLLQIKCSGGLTAVILGCWIPNREYWFICFDPEFLFNTAKKGKKSINKKELDFYCKKGYSISLKAKDFLNFTPEILRDRIIDFLPNREGMVGKV